MTATTRRPRYPALYQINTRVWLGELSRALGKTATLDDVPDRELDSLAAAGFDWVWLLGVWQTGPEGRRVSRANPEWRRELQETLPDLTDDDIGGSCFAVTGYAVAAALGGDAALARLRARLRSRGMRLLLDFVPNHTALDHPWVSQRSDFYVAGTDADLARAPENYVRVATARGPLVLAYGRDPYFAGWPDTLQLNYGNGELQAAMLETLERVAGKCDGVRCDMAMLVLPEVFERTWRIKTEPFWPRAIAAVRDRNKDFLFVAEVYWDLEWTLQRQGFDYAYDKRLYDRLRELHARPVREHFRAGLDYQDKLARFLENHDEPRAAATFPKGVHEAAAVVAFLSPGLRFFHQGQLEGRRKRISPHLCRGPVEPVDQELKQFYERLLPVLRRPALRDGKWQLLDCAAAWDGNWTSDCFVSSAWQGADRERLLVAVNFAPNQSQCYVRLPFPDLSGRQWRLEDLLGGASYDRDGNEMVTRGLYLDAPPWNCHVFAMNKVS